MFRLGLLGAFLAYVLHGMIFRFGGGGGGGSAPAITETADQVAQQQINQQLWDYYQTSYKPVVDQYIAKTTDSGNKTQAELNAEGQVNAQVMKNLNSANVDPRNPVNNVKNVAGLSQIEAGAQTQTQGGMRSRELAENQNIINIGRGQATSALTGMSDIASQSVSAEISDVELNQARQAASENAIGSIAGAVGAGLLRKFRPDANNPTAGMTGTSMSEDIGG